MENRTRQEVSIRLRAGWSVFGEYRDIFLNRHLPVSLQGKAFNQCDFPTVTYGCQAWSLTKQLVPKKIKKLETSQRAMERKMLNVKLKDRTRDTIVRQRTRITNIVHQCEMEMGWTHRQTERQ